MGYTIEKGKIVIWTTKVFEADKYPFNQEGENWTYFFKNLRDKHPFEKCLARLSDETKQNVVSLKLGISDFILKSKASHNKQKKSKK